MIKTKLAHSECSRMVCFVQQLLFVNYYFFLIVIIKIFNVVKCNIEPVTTRIVLSISDSIME